MATNNAINNTLPSGVTVTGTANINATGAAVTTIGSVTGASGTAIYVGTGNFVLDGVTNSTYTVGASTTTGTYTLGGTAQSGTMTLGSSSAANSLIIAGGSGATTLTLANVQTAGSVSIGAAMTTGTISIGGTGAQTGTVDIAPGTGAQIVTLGNGGTAAKTINIGNGIVGNTISIGNGNNSSAQTINIASGATAANSTVNIFSGNGSAGTQTLNILTGTRAGAINIGTGGAAHTINIGTSSGTGVVTIGNTTGNTAVTGSLTASVNLATTNGDVTVGNTASAATSPFVNFNKSRAGGVITAADVVGDIEFKGHDGTQYIAGARIVAISQSTIATNRIPTSLNIYTHADDTSAAPLRAVFNARGGIDIKAPTSGVGLDVQGGGVTITGGATVSTSDLTMTAGNINFPTTTSSAGSIFVNSIRFMHAFGTDNTFVGSAAGNYTLTTGSAFSNTAVGSAAMTAVTTGDRNACFGHLAGNDISQAGNSTFIGQQAGTDVTTGSHNTALGYKALFAVTTGAGNTCLGDNAGASLTGSDNNNIIIGLNVVGTAGDSGRIRIGLDATHTSCFITGIDGVSVTGTAVLISTSDQLGVAASSRRFKENIEDMGSASDLLMKLRPVTFNYKSDEEKNAQFGLIAEEVAEIMPDLVNYDKQGLPFTIRYHDMPAILLNEIQKMSKRIEILEAQLAGKEK